ncbi:hypothetical protein [Pontibacter pudoricolor]|uniref:hypothetical protein n=1 Tax=Pontibacter pudoricolor TaxID=2694930 RepID=UPI0013918F04|nr:hypothetical protein [Pontibacter pudoricolor]
MLLTSPLLLSCEKDETSAEIPFFEPEPVSNLVVPAITEASGIADSKTNPGYLWVHEDGGNPAQLHLLEHNGQSATTVAIVGAVNRDWEDMALSGNDLYLADIGDNNEVYANYTIYKFQEPAAGVTKVTSYETIKFRYADGSHDAEAMLRDPESKDIYLFTKRESPSRIYKLHNPKTTGVNTAELVGTLNYSGVVSATMSADGKGIIVKTYSGLWYYTRAASETIEQALQKNSLALPYKLEPQGEAVTFSYKNKGYFTLSEKGFTNTLNLYYYKMK